MNRPRRRCPVCYRLVRATRPLQHIESHWDSIDFDLCPGTGEPFRITLPNRPDQRQEIAA